MACSCQQILTLERTQHGWVQKTSFTHPDLHDELVEELVSLSSPFASAGAGSGASVFTFLLLGDQNAGKSTFLHAFSHAGSASWLALGSYLPILSASFLNASLRTDSATPPMDEPPFLDTDIGRASLLLTIEDFAFFVSEFELGAAVDVQALAAQRVAHVAVQLVEVGGDHLDSLMAAGEGDGGAPDDAWASVYARSRALIGGSRKSAYFVNAASLLRPDPAGRLRLDTTEAAPPVHRERAEEDRLMANGRAGPEEPPAEKQQPVALLGLRGRLALAAARPPRPVPASAPRHHRLQAARLAARLRYLASLLPPGPHQLVFYLSRLPPPEHGHGVFDEASAEAPPLVRERRGDGATHGSLAAFARFTSAPPLWAYAHPGVAGRAAPRRRARRGESGGGGARRCGGAARGGGGPSRGAASRAQAARAAGAARRAAVRAAARTARRAAALRGWRRGWRGGAARARVRAAVGRGDPRAPPARRACARARAPGAPSGAVAGGAVSSGATRLGRRRGGGDAGAALSARDAAWRGAAAAARHRAAGGGAAAARVLQGLHRQAPPRGRGGGGG